MMAARLLVIVRRFLLLLVLCQPSAADTPKQAPEQLRLLTYNIHMGEPGAEALASVIEQADADIVVLNEAWNAKQNEALAKNLGYHIAYGGQSDADKFRSKPHWIGRYYMPQVLLSRHRIVSTRFFNAKAAAEDPENPDVDPEVPIYRGGLLAEIETKQGHRVVVFALHLHPWGDAENEPMTAMRLAEIKGIVGQLKPHADKPILIMGDFNTQSHLDGKTGWKVTPYLDAQKFTDLYRAVHTDPATHRGLTWPDSRIDYIFGNRHVTAQESRVVEKGVFGSQGYDASDHLAVYAVVRVGEGDGEKNAER